MIIRLIIQEVTDLDAGEYTIVADNGIGPSVQSTVELIIFPLKPKLTIDVDKLVYFNGEGAVMRCTVRSYPPPLKVRYTYGIIHAILVWCNI